MKRVPFLLTVFLLVACSESSPTSPLAVTQIPVTDAALTGSWTTELNLHPAEEDWSRVRITLSAENGVITGEMVPLAGVRHPISGSVQNGFATLIIGDLPFDPHGPCIHVQIAVSAVETVGAQPRALLGSLGGRCPSTLMRDVRLNRD
ncbi:MAG TPA: hypothetical protein VFV49_02505 [Thermoanaerobaculia bacterium]|nr:hypothetical protein [Thermoanaerobaculia bacterium]